MDDNKSIVLAFEDLDNYANDLTQKQIVKIRNIEFEFPNGFNQLRTYEECKAYRVLDLDIPENFDFMYDITLQMVMNKPITIIWNANGSRKEIAKFVMNGKMDERNKIDPRIIPIFEEYPVLVEWLVERITVYLSKKYPHSLKEALELVSGKTKKPEQPTK